MDQRYFYCRLIQCNKDFISKANDSPTFKRWQNKNSLEQKLEHYSIVHVFDSVLLVIHLTICLLCQHIQILCKISFNESKDFVWNSKFVFSNIILSICYILPLLLVDLEKNLDVEKPFKCKDEASLTFYVPLLAIQRRYSLYV